MSWAFERPQVVINESNLKRRVLRFYLLKTSLVLDEDFDEERSTIRHKFRKTKRWSRLDHRNNTMERRPIPDEAIEIALFNVRAQIDFDPQG